MERKRIKLVPNKAMKETLYEMMGNREVEYVICFENQEDETERQRKLKALSEKRKRPIKCVTNYKQYESIAEASRALGLDPGAISRVLKGKQKTTHGYVFKYM